MELPLLGTLLRPRLRKILGWSFSSLPQSKIQVRLLREDAQTARPVFTLISHRRPDTFRISSLPPPLGVLPRVFSLSRAVCLALPRTWLTSPPI